MRRIKIGVTGTGSLIGQAIIKSVKNSIFRESASLVGFDYFDSTIGSFWVDKNYLLPDFLKPEVTAVHWLERIIEILKAEKIDFLFIGIDFELPLFARFKEEIESQSNCKVLVSALNVVEISDDKYLTYKFLKDNGLAYPRTFLPEEAGQAKILYPCILKPRKGSSSRNVFVVNSGSELKRYLSLAKDLIIQDMVGDPSEEYTCGVIVIDDEVKEIIALRRKLKDGVTVSATFRYDTPKEIYEYIRGVAMKLKPDYACNFQLRVTPAETAKIFEINARHSGTTYMRTFFGFREVEYILSCLLGLKPKQFNLREGTVKRYYEEKFIPL